MNNQIQVTKIKEYVFNLFNEDATGHDFYHMERVAKTAKEIAEIEQADTFITETAAWLHDVGDHKLFKNPDETKEKLNVFLRKIGVSDQQVLAIERAIKDVSFSKGANPETLEGKIVQDADRLDALGAIGIARTFAFGGSKGRPIHTNDDQRLHLSSIQHFYDKLLLLKDLMNTSAARAIAQDRHDFMESFLDQFYVEWNVK